MAYIGQNADGNFTTTPAKDTFNGDGSTVAFTLSQGGATNTVDVFVENVRQEPTEAYSVNGTTLTFTEAPGTGTGNIYVVNRGPAQLTATHPSGQALEATNGTFTGDLTVDTNTLVVDSTNNRVGIGTSSPSDNLVIDGGTLNGTTYITATNNHSDQFISVGINGNVGEIAVDDDDVMTFGHYNNYASKTYTERMRIDSSGNVGIGISSPGRRLDVKSSGTGAETVAQFGNNNIHGGLQVQTNGNLEWGLNALNTRSLTFSTNQTERMRIDSSGNVLVGKTSADHTTTGVRIGTSFISVVSGANANTAIFNRTGTDGEIVRFQNDNTTIGKIGTFNGYPFYGHATQSGAGLLYVSTTIRPFDCNTQTQSDNEFDLGTGSTRFDDIYATNGTIQTSDQNEKQQIDSLTSAEITAAKAISKLFKTFKWNDKVEAKGDAARTHTGVIAQDVQQAMTDAGLDAGDYAFFISATWWEAQTEVPAVEADEENGIEAADAYTRTDTYDTAEEAPEGATERTRLGIRYPELLAFVGAATEQRLADIETRLTALEAE